MITTESLEIEEELANKINNICSFLNIEVEITEGSLITIDNTNLAYIEPHKVTIKETDYLFFNTKEEVYINDLTKSIKISNLKKFIQNN